MIDKNSPIPIYFQIQEYVREKIKKQEWERGSVIPSERILTEAFEVSRMTIRQAIQGLVDEGILVRKRGSGTYVNDQKVEQPLQSMMSFTRLMESTGMKAAARVLSFTERKATETEANVLEIETGSRVIHLERIRLGNEIPIAIETSVIPKSLAKGLTKAAAEHSLYQFLQEKAGLQFGEARQSIEAVSADERTAELLDIAPGSPILLIERVASLKNGLPFEYVHSFYAGNRFKFYL
ncbi:GntR family transcriptional regulator [Heyndrickxia acidicola]|uniref:GntR family transcriptional regulator n=1 Tax=Heyndrickxia acidicola TaxID=209389 RepID=A0ABU6MF53_9BACI|nr:GntR family transcriptional regulator [Heyndrickxia acidicola]MED1203299.1 GntR family transcriptional regulator [Heyndrickxia acidicola]